MPSQIGNHVSVIDPTIDKRWDDFVAVHPRATVYHHSAWARVLHDRYGHRAMYYVLESDDGEIQAGAPFFRIRSSLTGQRLVCLPSCEYCFPLSDSRQNMTRLVARVRDEVESGKASYLEIRGWGDTVNPGELGLNEHAYFVTHVANLAGGPDRWTAMINRMTRRNLKRAEESLTVREGQDEGDIRTFHRLSVATRARVNLLPWPYRFFRAIYQHMLIPGHGFLILAELGGKAVGGSLCFRFKNTVIDRYNAWDSTFSQYRPNYLLVWRAMERAYREGYQWFDFGVSNPENTGLLNFKRLWWTEEKVMPYYYYPARHGISAIPQTSLTYRIHTGLNRVMPVFALELLGQAVNKLVG